ncbi:hypothetical protein [Aliiroseovarius sp. F20344]|uniref:COG3904 family protein n=1 Tax=Aliiroseovarius sp. F20344 TaxID=2926414 RepID=UPI001FF1A1C8|nr:hypothetical protein [Aliiroseovarius sp. F20344]MCK0141367.1 hypothetical protein [Aliiroseovarius sp. F20344]
MRYFQTHWRGDQPPIQSFWVNAVGLRLFIIATFLALTNFAPLPIVVVVTLFASDLLLLVWQATGYFRSVERQGTALGAQLPIWGGVLGLVVAVFMMISLWWGLWLATDVIIEQESYSERRARENAQQYALYVSPSGTDIHLEGTITGGVTKAFRTMMEAHPGVQTFHLSSEGGNIFEARGLVKLVEARALNTNAVDQCSSACTLVFMAGAARTAAQNTTIGFHGYTLESAVNLVLFDVEAEEKRDRAYLSDRGLPSWFIEKAFATRPPALWMPSREELFRAGVLTK